MGDRFGLRAITLSISNGLSLPVITPAFGTAVLESDFDNVGIVPSRGAELVEAYVVFESELPDAWLNGPELPLAPELEVSVPLRRTERSGYPTPGDE